MNTNDVSRIIACGPESNKEASVLLREPVSHDSNKAGEEKGIEHANHDLDKVKVSLMIEVKEAY